MTNVTPSMTGTEILSGGLKDVGNAYCSRADARSGRKCIATVDYTGIL